MSPAERQKAVLEEVCEHRGSLRDPSDRDAAGECVALGWLDHQDGLYVITLTGVDQIRPRQGPGSQWRHASRPSAANAGRSED